MRTIEQTAVGQPNATEAAKADRNFTAIGENFRITQTRAGFAGRQVWARFGDSMCDYGANPDWAAVFAAVRYLHYDYNAVIDPARYYEQEDTNVPPARLPAGQRGLNFSKGGTTVQHMLNVQLPAILEALADGRKIDVAVGSAFQNDRWNNLTEAKATVGKALQFVDALLERGIDVLLLGTWPHNDLVVNGTANAYAKHYVERAMALAAETRPGLRVVPILDVLKRGDPAEEAQGKVNWVGGAKGTIGSATLDDIHAAAFGARLAAPAVAEAIRPMVRRFNPPAFDGLPYDDAKNPLGNFYGASGRFVGSGGKITDLSKASGASDRTVTSANVPAGTEILYPAGIGITVTPSLTGDSKWPYQIDFTGTPTADAIIILARLVSGSVVFPIRPMEIYGKARWVNMRGLSGIACGQGEIDVPAGGIRPIRCPVGSAGNTSQIMPFALSEEITLHSMAPADFENQYGSPTRLDVTTAVVAGVPISGAIQFSRLGLFRATAA